MSDERIATGTGPAAVVTVTVLLSNTQEVKLTVDIALRLKAVVVDKADGV